MRFDLAAALRRSSRNAAWIACAGTIAGGDQLSKLWVERNLPIGEPVDLLPFLSLFRTHNTGIAFSMLSFAGEKFLIAMTLAIMALVSTLFAWTPDRRLLTKLGLSLVMGGAAGNLADRLRFGHVVDFVLVHWQSWSFAVFNLADAAITVGAILVAADELRALAGRKTGGKPG